MKQQATQMMWFYDRQHGQWSLSDHVSCEPWARRETHPGPPNLSGKRDRSGFRRFSCKTPTIPASQASSSVTCAMRTARYTTRSGTVSMCLHRGSVVAGLPPRNDASRDGSRNSPAGVAPPLPCCRPPCWPSWRRRFPPRRGSIFARPWSTSWPISWEPLPSLAHGAGWSRQAESAGEPRHRRQGVCPLRHALQQLYHGVLLRGPRE